MKKLLKNQKLAQRNCALLTHIFLQPVKAIITLNYEQFCISQE